MRPAPCTLIALHAAMAISLLWLPARASAGEMSAACPASIPAETFAPGRPPSGWTAFVSSKLHLTGAGMRAGPPAEMEYLVPNEQGREFQAYDFQKGDRQRWLWCSYNGGMQISRRLDDGATKCTITETRRKKDLTSAAVKCQ